MSEIENRLNKAIEDVQSGKVQPKYKKIKATRKDLERFYKDWAMCNLGIMEEDIPLYVASVNASADDAGEREMPVYMATGDLINKTFGLVGQNAFKKRLNCIFIPSEYYAETKNPGALCIGMRMVGFRWFTDVIDNSRP